MAKSPYLDEETDLTNIAQEGHRPETERGQALNELMDEDFPEPDVPVDTLRTAMAMATEGAISRTSRDRPRSARSGRGNNLRKSRELRFEGMEERIALDGTPTWDSISHDGTTRTASFDADSGSMFVGASTYSKYDANGDLAWSHPYPSIKTDSDVGPNGMSAVAAYDSGADLFDSAGNVIAHVDNGGLVASNVAISPNGEHWAVRWQDGNIRIYEVATGSYSVIPGGGLHRDLVFLDDDHVGYAEGDHAEVYSISSGQVTASVPGDGKDMQVLAGGEGYLVSGGYYGEILVGLDIGGKIGTAKMQNGQNVYAIEHLGGSYFAIGGGGGWTEIQDASSPGTAIWSTSMGSIGDVSGVEFVDIGRIAITGRNGQTVMVNLPEEVTALLPVEEPVPSFTGDELIDSEAVDSAITDLPEDQPVVSTEEVQSVVPSWETLSANNGMPRTIDVSSDGKLMASGEGMTFLMRDTETGQVLWSHQAIGLAIHVDIEGEYVSAALREDGLYVWRVATGEQVHHTDAAGSLANYTALSPNGEHVAVNEYGRGIRIENVGGGGTISVPSGGDQRDMKFIDEDRLAFVVNDHVEIFSISSQSIVASIPGDGNTMTVLDAADGLIAIGGYYGKITTGRDTGEKLGTAILGNGANVYGIEMLGGGYFVAVGGGGQIEIRNATDPGTAVWTTNVGGGKDVTAVSDISKDHIVVTVYGGGSGGLQVIAIPEDVQTQIQTAKDALEQSNAEAEAAQAAADAAAALAAQREPVIADELTIEGGQLEVKDGIAYLRATESGATITIPETAPDLLNTAHVMPGPLTQMQVQVYGKTANGESRKIHDELITGDRSISWYIEDDIVRVDTIVFGNRESIFTHDQYGYIGGFGELSSRDTQKVPAGGEEPWQHLKAPQGFTTLAQSASYLDYLDSLRSYYAGKLPNPYTLDTSNDTMQFLFAKYYPQLLDIPAEVESRLAGFQGTEGQIAEQRSYLTRLLMGQSTDAVNAIRQNILNHNENIRIHMGEFAKYLERFDGSVDNARGAYQIEVLANNNAAQTLRNSMGIKPVSQAYIRVSMNDVTGIVIGNQEYFASLDLKIEELRAASNNIIGDVPVNGLQDFLNQLPQEILDFFETLPAEAQRAFRMAYAGGQYWTGERPEDQLVVGEYMVALVNDGNFALATQVAMQLSTDPGGAYQVAVAWRDGVTTVAGGTFEAPSSLSIEHATFFANLPTEAQRAFLSVYENGQHLTDVATPDDYIVGRFLVDNAGNEEALALGKEYGLDKHAIADALEASNLWSAETEMTALAFYNTAEVATGRIDGEQNVEADNVTMRWEVEITEPGTYEVALHGMSKWDLSQAEIVLSNGQTISFDVFGRSTTNLIYPQAGTDTIEVRNIGTPDTSHASSGVIALRNVDYIGNAGGVAYQNSFTAGVKHPLPGENFSKEIAVGNRLDVVRSLVDIERFGGGEIEANKETWLVIHGRESSRGVGDGGDGENNIYRLAGALQGYAIKNDEQVLTLDWRSFAGANLPVTPIDGITDEIIDINFGLHGANFIQDVAQALYEKLPNLSPDQIRIASHSWGTLVGHDLALNVIANTGQKVNSFVSLDTAGNSRLLGSNYPIDTVDFRNVATTSWAFEGSAFGSDERSARADMTMRIEHPFAVSPGTQHGLVVETFARLASEASSNPDNPALSNFNLDKLVSGDTASFSWLNDSWGSIPLRPDGFDGSISTSLTGEYHTNGTPIYDLTWLNYYDEDKNFQSDQI
jgi:hypothetical protein